MLRKITLAIIIGTAAIGGYYVVVPMYSPSSAQSPLSVELNRLEEGLSYSKFIEMSESERMNLVQRMPSRTIDLIVEEAKKRDTFVSEDLSEILPFVESSELKFPQIAEFKGVKGNKVTGQAMIVTAGEKTFLRFEDFFVTNGPVLHVYLTKSGDIETGFDLGRLKANNGNQNYETTGIDTEAYSVVVISSKPFGLYYATANLPANP